MIDWADWLTWKAAKEFFNSQFITSLLGALAGAWGGARAAQRIAQKAKERGTLLNEVKNTNAAIQIAANVFSAFGSFKEQLSKPLKIQYDRERAYVTASLDQMARGVFEGELLHVAPDVQRHEELYVETAQLEEAVLKSLSVSGRPRALASMVTQSRTALNNAISSRNQQLVNLEASEADVLQRIRKLYGVPLADGSVTNLYRDTVAAIDRHADAAVYFSYRMCLDLQRYGHVMRTAYTRQYSSRIPQIVIVDFTDAIARGIIPPLDEYETWENNFYERMPQTIRRRPGKVWYAMRRFGRYFTGPIRRAISRSRKWWVETIRRRLGRLWGMICRFGRIVAGPIRRAISRLRS